MIVLKDDLYSITTLNINESKQISQRKRFSVAHLMGSLFALDQLQYSNGCMPLNYLFFL